MLKQGEGGGRDSIQSSENLRQNSSILVPLAVAAAREATGKNDNLGSRTNHGVDERCCLLEFCLGSINFSFKGELFKQISRTATGAAISVTTANLTMETIEQRGLQSFASRPKVFLRYVDDCFCIFKRADVNNFLAHLNSIKPAIQFMAEYESDNTSPFLYVLVARGGEELNIESTSQTRACLMWNHISEKVWSRGIYNIRLGT